MKSAPNHRVRRLAVAGVAGLALITASGCSAVNEQATAIQYAASDGIVENLGPLELRNILIVTADEGEPGTMLGTVFNKSDSTAQLTIEAENETSEISIPAGEKYVFEDEATDDGTLEGISGIPGSLVDLDFSVDGESAAVRVPVLDGTLEEYREFVPGGFTPDPEPSEEEPAAEEEG